MHRRDYRLEMCKLDCATLAHILNAHPARLAADALYPAKRAGADQAAMVASAWRTLHHEDRQD